MPKTMKISTSSVIEGDRFDSAITVVGATQIETAPTVPAAKTGTLPTRTDNTTGSLTMDAGHGFTTAAKIDLFWSVAGVRYSRQGVVCGTVTSNTVPISGGTGDNLPPATTAVTAMVPASQAFAFAGDSAVGYGVSSPKQGYVSFALTDGTIVKGHPLQDGGAASWGSGTGVTNPLAGAAVAKVLFSHRDPSGPAVMTASALTN